MLARHWTGVHRSAAAVSLPAGGINHTGPYRASLNIAKG